MTAAQRDSIPYLCLAGRRPPIFIPGLRDPNTGWKADLQTKA